MKSLNNFRYVRYDARPIINISNTGENVYTYFWRSSICSATKRVVLRMLAQERPNHQEECYFNGFLILSTPSLSGNRCASCRQWKPLQKKADRTVNDTVIISPVLAEGLK